MYAVKLPAPLLLSAPLALGIAGVLFGLLVHTSFAQDDPKSLAPSGLTAQLVDGVVTLEWDLPAKDAVSVTGHEVLRRPHQDEYALSNLVSDTGSEVPTSYRILWREGSGRKGVNVADTYDDDTALTHGETYRYRGRAPNAGGAGPASDTASVLAVLEITGPSSVSYPENQTLRVATYSVVSATGDLVWSLSGDDGDDFSIDGGVLRFLSPPNYETPSDTDGDNAYAVTIQVAEEGSENSTLDAAVSVTNVDEEGTVSIAPDHPQVGTVLRAKLSDPDGWVSPSSVTWQWARSSDRNSWHSLASAANSYVPTDGDQGMYLRATAEYSHGRNSAEAVSDHVVGDRESAPQITVVSLVSGLSRPWGVGFTPDGTLLFTEKWTTQFRGGLSARLGDGTVQSVTADFSDLLLINETGLLALVVDPDFASNRRFYTCQSHTGPDEVQVVAWTINDDYTAATRIADPLVGGIPIIGDRGRHSGCRLRFGPDGYLWIATGDGFTVGNAQDLTSLGGKMLRVNAATGAGAPGNPFSAPNSPLIYTYGHRNPQGLALRPGTSQMWSVEHGPHHDDEINLLTVGGNYGWDPGPGYREGGPMTDLVQFPDAVPAKWSSGDPTLAPSGGIYLDGDDWDQWEGRLAVATLKNMSLRVFGFTPEGTLVSEVLVPELDGTYGRLRTPMLGPDGALYVTTSNGYGKDHILKVIPVQLSGSPPTFPSDTDTQPEASENSLPSMIIAMVAASDPEDGPLTYSLSGPDAAFFNLANTAVGELRVNTWLDYEAKNSHEVVVTATDPQGLSDSVSLTINVTNEEEPGTITLSSTQPKAGEELEASLTDPDGGIRNATWQWERSPDRANWTVISGATSDAYTPVAADAANYLRVTASYTDGQGSGKTAREVTVSPSSTVPAGSSGGGSAGSGSAGGGGGRPVNTAPVFRDAEGNAIVETTRVIAEDAAPGSKIGGPVAATGPNGGTLTYTVGGDDAALFSIDASTGELTTTIALDHETKANYTVTVIATDVSGATAEILVTIVVADVDFDCSSGNAVVDAADHPGLVADCEALLEARDKLAGSDALNWSEDTPITEWKGVSLGGTPRRVTRLYLARKGLAGTLPADLSGLTRLEGLYLHRNELTGPIPPQLSGLSRLIHLTLHRNRLVGEMPAGLGDMTGLVFLSLYGNNLTSEIPAELGSLSNLRWLYLHGNKSADGDGLSGAIPAALGGLRNLERLLLYGNSLSGAIPAELGELSNLKSLLVHDNDLTGQIPSELGKMSNLRYLWLDDNDLSEQIPSELGDLTSLRWLSLYGNNLSGPIPSELGDLTSLRLLIFDRNDLTGPIPSGLGALSDLTWLSLHNNHLSGPIPGELGDLPALRHLYLHDNDLTGLVPEDLGRLSNLTNLWLRDNRLSGQIPPSLGDLPNLRRVRIGGNAFTGCIPAGLLDGPSWYSDAGELGLPACGNNDGS